jgi:transglutaminase-like putative cysteine protease
MFDRITAMTGPALDAETAAPPDGVPATENDPQAYLGETYYIETGHPGIAAFAEKAVAGARTDVEKAIKLFYAVRDGFPYNPYNISGARDDYRASHTLNTGSGWCVQKGVLMTATARAAGIPARPGYADVKNHLATPRMLALMGNDYFSYHGYVELWLEAPAGDVTGGRWVKVTPVFNKELCDKFNVRAQEFDGTGDALFQEYDSLGRRHMEYLLDRGPYTDLPFQEIYDDFWERYVPMRPVLEGKKSAKGDFHAEAEKAGKSV